MQGKQSRRVLIVGGGIGGLTTAIALRRAGIDATVFERVADLRAIQVGGGIHLWINAMRAMQQVQLGEQVAAVGARVDFAEFITWQGRTLGRWPVGDLGSQVGAHTYGMSRADLHRVLIDELDGGMLQMGAELTHFAQDSQGVTARFADGREERGDVLIGADGIKSTVRKQLLGDSPLRYTGYTIVHAITGTDFNHPAIPLGVFRVWWGRGQRFNMYHVGGNRLYWFAIVNALEGRGDFGRDVLLERFQGYTAPVTEAIEATEPRAMSRMDHYDRKPVKSWGAGRVTLLGDAAHAMTLNLGQGACQTVEDAVVVARCLANNGDMVGALRRYEEQRMNRTASFVNLAWRLGQLGRLTNPVAVSVRDTVLGMVFPSFVWRQHGKSMVYEF